MSKRHQLFFKYVTPIPALMGGTLRVSNAVSVYFSYQGMRYGLLALEYKKARSAAMRVVEVQPKSKRGQA
jgi:hypothetical protein